LKYLSITIIFCLVAFNVYAQKIATFKFAFILENLPAYNDFIKHINDFKKKRFEELRKQEELLIIKKKEIDDSEVLLSKNEYLSIITEFNESKDNFENSVNKLNNYLKENIELTEKKILNEIANIIKEIATENSLDIVFFDEQYFLASDSMDISDQISNNLNNLKITLQLTPYE